MTKNQLFRKVPPKELIVKVVQAYGQNYNREKAYAEDIDAQLEAANKAKYGSFVPQKTTQKELGNT